MWTLFYLSSSLGIDASTTDASVVKDISLRSISSRPELVNGGEVLVGVAPLSTAPWHATLNGNDVTSLFKPGRISGGYIARLTNLLLGRNTLLVQQAGHTVTSLVLINHDVNAPLFSGPRQKPFICQTELSGLGAALDADCSAKTVVQYLFKAAATADQLPRPEIPQNAEPLDPPFGFKLYEPGKTRLEDIAMTLTSEGRKVPLIVRRETGTINRAVYDIRFLHQPDHPLPSPWVQTQDGWNGRLVYLFAGGCGPGYAQGALGELGSEAVPFLTKGYATATSTLNRFQMGCDEALSAETLSRVKEHFIKTYGEPAATLGWGVSGGGMALYLTAQDYPGLLDGIMPEKSFPDPISFAQISGDCTLLAHAFEGSNFSWAEAQKAAVSGHSGWHACRLYSINKINPFDAQACPETLPKSLRFDRETNPRGARCDMFSGNQNTYGRDSKTGAVPRAYDNFGVQYGLEALNSGQIDIEHFLDVNERVGGFDADGFIVERRNDIDESVARAVYRLGQIVTGGGGLKTTPVIDWRPYTDDLGVVDGHNSFLSLATRQRLIAANGQAANQVILVRPRSTWFERDDNASWGPAAIAELLDHWVTGAAKDKSGLPRSDVVLKNKPSELSDSCWSDSGSRIEHIASFAKSDACNQLYPPFGEARIGAGGPLADDVVKCELKPLASSDYRVRLTDRQLVRLRAIFPRGVCDYDKPGIGQRADVAVWVGERQQTGGRQLDKSTALPLD